MQVEDASRLRPARFREAPGRSVNEQHGGCHDRPTNRRLARMAEGRQ